MTYTRCRASKTHTFCRELKTRAHQQHASKQESTFLIMRPTDRSHHSSLNLSFAWFFFRCCLHSLSLHWHHIPCCNIEWHPRLTSCLNQLNGEHWMGAGISLWRVRKWTRKTLCSVCLAWHDGGDKWDKIKFHLIKSVFPNEMQSVAKNALMMTMKCKLVESLWHPYAPNHCMPGAY